ncbi:tRNA (adenosine(37)-N6)-threonylcarbamoyltransferase complex ATPase subunit type 1 TsaE [Catenulispora yoronensis]|uniref:tRNA threonylcarbamoyladenosine biosynthesis protein TsaE n=1 Tax=Catenulispora yoronensis TaxID=450799 RepID=A0ABP5FF39_9ACTN
MSVIPDQAGPGLPGPVLETPVATASAMHDLGRRLGARLRPGDLVVLTGDLGAGKTTLTQGLGEGLAVRGPITSPTFVIARVHPSIAVGGIPLVHVDAYRLGTLDELDDLDLDASVAESVTVVEWGEGKAEVLTDDRLDIVIAREFAEDLDEPGDSDVRWVAIRGIGTRWTEADLADLVD